MQADSSSKVISQMITSTFITDKRNSQFNIHSGKLNNVLDYEIRIYAYIIYQVLDFHSPDLSG